MIRLNKKQQALTYLSLIQSWEVNPEKLNSSEAVQREATAELLAYHIGAAHIVQHAAQMLRRAMAGQEMRHTFTAIDMDDLTALLGSAWMAGLVARVAGFWPKYDDENRLLEWSNCSGAGGPRNDLDLPSQLVKLRILEAGDKEAA